MTGIVVAVSIWIVFVVWTATIVSRAGIRDPGERVLWYLVIFSLPFVGSLLVLRRFGRRPAAKPLDQRMTEAIADAHRQRSDPPGDQGTPGL